MSRHGDVAFEWGGEERTFRLALGEIRKLQERTNAGPYELLRRLTTGTWRVDDLRETIRLGLVGGGTVVNDKGATDDNRIARLVRDYVDERPLQQSVMVAARILEAALAGAPDEDIPKSEGAETTSPQSLETASSPSPPSTDGDRPLDTRQGTSTDSPSGSSKPARLDSSSPMAPRTSQSHQAPNNTQSL